MQRHDMQEARMKEMAKVVEQEVQRARYFEARLQDLYQGFREGNMDKAAVDKLFQNVMGKREEPTEENIP